MKSNSLSETGHSLSQITEEESKNSNNIDFSGNYYNSNLSKDFTKNLSNISVNSCVVPINLSSATNQAAFSQNITNSNETKEKEGIFSKFFNFIKSPWTIEEEEFIDAHGFKAKRPKKKIPLRKKEDKINSDIQIVGGQSVVCASRHTGFGNLFL